MHRNGRIPRSHRGPEGSKRPRLFSLTRYAAAVVSCLLSFGVLATGATTGSVDAPDGPTAPGGAAAAASADPSGQVDRASAIRFTTATGRNPAELRAFYGQHPDWTACGHGTDQCASVRVPVDYAKPGGATVDISVHKVIAIDHEKRRGTLFINPGGPGESGLGFAEAAGSVFGPHVLARYDIVGFDPRGLGESGGFECLTKADLDEQYSADPTPETADEKAALARAASRRAAGCLRRGGELARHMGSESVARDLDIMRDSVGDPRLNYYGVSYGTLIGATYADLFTTRVGLMVLDSAVTPDGDEGKAPTQGEVDDSARHAAYAFDDTFDDFVTDCTDNGSCPVGATKTEAISTLVRFIDRLEKKPLPTDIDSLPTLTEGWAVTAIDGGLREPDSWGNLRDALETALAGDGTDLAAFAMEVVYRYDDGTYDTPSFGSDSLPITCADWPLSAWDRAMAGANVLSSHPLWARLENYPVPTCTGWTGPVRQNLDVGVLLPTPILVIGNERDPVTPLGDTEAMAGAFPSARFVSVDAEGHGALDNDNQCADQVIEDYLADGIPPDDHFDCRAD